LNQSRLKAGHVDDFATAQRTAEEEAEAQFVSLVFAAILARDAVRRLGKALKARAFSNSSAADLHGVLDYALRGGEFLFCDG
jgi:hypothetical protein